MADYYTTAYRLREELRDHYADVMLAALKEAGVHLSVDEYYSLKEKLSDVLRGQVTV
jgi:hypothetical protein